MALRNNKCKVTINEYKMKTFPGTFTCSKTRENQSYTNTRKIVQQTPVTDKEIYE